jgi:hypothetical protein
MQEMYMKTCESKVICFCCKTCAVAITYLNQWLECVASQGGGYIQPVGCMQPPTMQLAMSEADSFFKWLIMLKFCLFTF